MRRTHRHVVVVAPLGVLHFWWMVNNDVTEAAIYAVVLAVLLATGCWRYRTTGANARAW